ncbi:MAG TPA: hypothetical protein VF381_11615 [Thermoanaerobaculia bacterium]
MDTKSRVVVLAAAAILGGCAAKPASVPAPAPAPQPATQPATPAAALVDHAGDSIETAVTVPADAANGGWNFTNDWIFDRIGKFRRTGGGTGMAGERRYNVVEVETPKGDHYKFFFDITENWNRWTPPK